ncbi:hypothetical protein [Janthinobacterium fluminis]|uniref:ABC-2 type transport system permease protein n=1 Tax=Janthinobacterium fluminis TaxID=2987524 RepID=A0ABT5K099_9BURK|nr:hypothetical protein [Janthinobacterium fluminis]MDC8758329.1 hypothetical protein [Janthinobacterium fluminis]
MKTMQWLIKRELWEHKGMVLWTPVVVGAVMTLLAAIMLTFAASNDAMHATLTINGQRGSINQLIVNALGNANRGATAEMMGASYVAAAAPLFLMLGALVFFYCLGTLYDERRDRSLLFWKSLPVSDAQTVLSKAALALAVLPLISIAVGALASLLMLLMLCALLATHGVNLFGHLLGTPDLYLTPLRLLALLPVYILWALPTVGWLLMVSAWARSKALLWAVGTPLLTGLLVTWIEKSFALTYIIDWFMREVVGRALLGVVPGFWFMLDKVNQQGVTSPKGPALTSADLLVHSWATLGNPGVWVGAAAGAAMIYAAIKLRQTHAEI